MATPRPIASRDSDLSQVSDSNEGDKQPKKLPPIKAPVGLARSPDLKSCKSKVGSLNNIKHTPAGGRVKIETQKLNWQAKSKVGSLENKEHKPAGGNVTIESRKLEWKTSSKVQSLQNIKHKAGGGNVKIFNESYRDKSIKSGLATRSEPAPTPDASESTDSSMSTQQRTTTTTSQATPDKRSQTTTADSLSRGLKDVKLNK